MKKFVKWTPLIRGKLSYIKYANPELEKKFSSVETLYGVPKAKAKVKRKSRPQTYMNMAMKIVVV